MSFPGISSFQTMKTLFTAFMLLLLARPTFAGDLHGTISDKTGGVLKTATVRLLDVTTGQETTATVDANGQYRFPDLRPGVYWLAVTCPGFSAASRTIVIEDAKATTTADFVLELGGLKTDVNVTAERGERDANVLPIRTDTLTKDAIDGDVAGEHGRRDDRGARRHAGRLRTVPGAAAAARARLDARARARRRRSG